MGETVRMSEKDKLAAVREAGQIIRDALAANVHARMGDPVSKPMLDEFRTVLASIVKSYLRQVFPDVEVHAFVEVLPPDIDVTVFVAGQFHVTATFSGEVVETPPNDGAPLYLHPA